MEFLQALQSYRRLMEEEYGVSAGLDDRQGLLADFRTARVAARLVGFKMQISQEGETPRASPALLSSLRPILLRELTVGRKHDGRILYGTLIEVPFKLVGIMTILEDGAGDAVAMAVHHAVRSSASRSVVESLYPQGMRVAVKEPHFKLEDRRLIVRVDNPADIIDWVPEAVEEEVGYGLSGETAESLREVGKRYFSEGQWYRAIQAFSGCIRVLEARSDSDDGPGLRSPTVS